MADVKSLFKKKAKKKNTLNTSVIPTSNQHIDAEALSSKIVEKSDDGWADKEEKKKVVVSTGKALGDIQSLTIDKNETSTNEDKDKTSSSTPATGTGTAPTASKGWGKAEEVVEEVKPEVEVEPEKPKPFMARRPPSGAAKPNTDDVQQFPTLGAAAASTTSEKAPGSVASSNSGGGGGSYLQSGSFGMGGSDSMSSAGGRPRLALKPRTAPLPEPPVAATTTASSSLESSSSPVKAREVATSSLSSESSGSTDQTTQPVSKADSVSSWRGTPTALPPSRSNDMPGGPIREANASWRERREVPGGNAAPAERSERSERPPFRESPADTASSWTRGQAAPPGPASSSSMGMRTPDREGGGGLDRATSSWRERSSPAASNSPADTASSWTRGQASPSGGSGGGRFGGASGGTGERPKLALKPRSVKEP